MSSGRVLILLAVAASSSGCSWHGLTHAFTPNCHSVQEYQRAVQVAPLRVPAGLDAPNVSGALVIPAADVAAPTATAPGDACLDEPPRYKAPPPAKSAAEAMPSASK